MKDYEDEAFDELEKSLQRKVAHGVTDGSLWRKRQEPERSMKVEGPLHVVCQCDQCKAQPEQEPVAWMNDTGTHIDLNVSGRGTPLYTHPPQRTWVGLTNEEIKAFDAWHDNREEEIGWCNPSEIVAYIEAKFKEKNT